MHDLTKPSHEIRKRQRSVISAQQRDLRNKHSYASPRKYHSASHDRCHSLIIPPAKINDNISGTFHKNSPISTSGLYELVSHDGKISHRNVINWSKFLTDFDSLRGNLFKRQNMSNI